jgi:hypothetical protein
MKATKTTPPPAPVAAQAPAAAPAPAFNAATAKAVEPFRHEETGRTISFLSPEGEGANAFSATGLFIATLPAAQLSEAQLAALTAKPTPPPLAPPAL